TVGTVYPAARRASWTTRVSSGRSRRGRARRLVIDYRKAWTPNIAARAHYETDAAGALDQGFGPQSAALADPRSLLRGSNRFSAEYADIQPLGIPAPRHRPRSAGLRHVRHHRGGGHLPRRTAVRRARRRLCAPAQGARRHVGARPG